MARDSELQEFRCSLDIHIVRWRNRYICDILRLLTIINKCTIFIAYFDKTTILLSDKMQKLLIGL